MGVLYLTSYMNFFGDEWNLVSNDRAWNLTLFMVPNNGHWSAIPILFWKLLFVVVGLRSHIPYEALLLIFHVAAVLLLFTLVRRRSGDLPAFGAALILLVLGSGGTNIVWAFQIGWVGSVAFGLLALVLLEGNPAFRSRMFIAAAALLCSLMCSGVGIAFLAATGVELALDRRRRRFLLALVAPTAVYAAWFVAFGPGGPNHVGSVASLVGFVLWGLESSAGAILGSSSVGAAFLPILAILIALNWYSQGHLKSWQIGMTVGILVWFTLAGLEQTPIAQAVAGDPRNVYVGAVFLLPIVAQAAGELPWVKLWRPALVAAFTIVLASNFVQLWDLARSETDLMRTQNAELQTVQVFRGAPDMSLNRSLDESVMPQLNAATYFAAIDELGSPVPSATVSSLPRLPWQAVDRAMVDVFRGALTVAADSNRSTAGMPCQTIDSTAGATIDLRISDGQWVMLQSTEGGDAFLFLGFLGAPSSEPLQQARLVPGTPEWIHLPSTGRPAIWKLRIRISPVGMLQLCGITSIEAHQPIDMYYAPASSGILDSPGWSSVIDAAASIGHAAMASHGTYVSFDSAAFGAGIEPVPRGYDVWYRVRVTHATGATPEMQVGVWDVQARASIASSLLAANQVGTSYTWIRVAAGIKTAAHHSVYFLATFIYRLGSDWYVDEAVMVPTDSPGGTG